MDNVYRILSIDGGGVFGVIPATLLFGLDVSPTDMFAGTSVGSEIALALASGIQPHDVQSQFVSMSKEVFARTTWQKLRSWRRPRYTDTVLNGLLQKMLPGTLADIPKHVVVPSKDLANDRFKVWENIDFRDDMDTPAWEVARMSSAAPTFFPPWKGHIDGAWCANDPACVAVITAMNKAKVPIDKIRVLSLGTGSADPVLYDAKSMAKWGPAKFLKPMINGVTKSNEQVVEHTMNTLRPLMDNYIRFNCVPLDSDWDIDDASCIRELVSRVSNVRQLFYSAWEAFIA